MSLQIDETAEKLDSMMFLVFEYLRTRAAQGQLQRTWQAALDSFFTTVLNTHKSKFTQYLLWYLLDQVRSLSFTDVDSHPPTHPPTHPTLSASLSTSSPGKCCISVDQ